MNEAGRSIQEQLLREEIERLRKELVETLETTKWAVQHLAEANDEIAQLKRDVASWRLCTEGLQTTIAQRDAEISELKDILSQRVGAMAYLQKVAQVELQSKTISQMRDEIERLREEIKDAVVREMVDEVADAPPENLSPGRTLREFLDVVKANIEIARLRDMVADWKTECDNRDSEIQELRRAVLEDGAEITRLQSLIRDPGL